MTDKPGVWTPTVASLIANLSHLAESGPVELRVPKSPIEAHVGLDPNGSRWLRITCPPRSVAVDDTTAAVRFKVTSHGYIVIVEPTVAPTVSTSFLDEIVMLLTDGHPPGSAGSKALQNWRELLAKPPGKLLDGRALAGLYGELEVLEAILRNSGPFHAWTGWMKDQNDFRLPGLVIEVKTTLSPNYRRVVVHGLNQLADPEDGSDLVLVLRRLEPSADGRSVPDLVDSCVDEGAPHSELLEQLAAIGYSEQHRGHYEQHRFVSKEIALRSVDDDHPRLVEASIAGKVDLSCIGRVDYELDLNGEADADLDTTLEEIIVKQIGASR